MQTEERSGVCDKCNRELKIFEFPKYYITDFKRLNYPPNLKFDESILQYEDIVPEALCLVPTEVINYFKKSEVKGDLVYRHEGFAYKAHVMGSEIKEIKSRKDIEPKLFVDRWLNQYFIRLEENIGKEVRGGMLMPELFKKCEEYGENLFYNIPNTSVTLLMEESRINGNSRRVNMGIVNLIGWGAGISSHKSLADVGIMVYEGRLNQI